MSKIRAEEIDIHFWIILDSRRSCGWVSGLWGCGEESRAEKLFSTCILCRACLLIPTQCLEYKSIFSWGPTAQQRLWRVLFFLMLLFYSFFFLSRVLYLHQNFNRGLSITSRSLYIFLNGPKSRRKKKKGKDPLSILFPTKWANCGAPNLCRSDWFRIGWLTWYFIFSATVSCSPGCL